MTEQYQPIADLIGRVRARWRRLVALQCGHARGAGGDRGARRRARPRAWRRRSPVELAVLGVLGARCWSRRRSAGHSGRCASVRPTGALRASSKNDRAELDERLVSAVGVGDAAIEEMRAGASPASMIGDAARAASVDRARGDRPVRVVAPDRIPGGGGRARVRGRRVFRRGTRCRQSFDALSLTLFPSHDRPRRDAGRRARRRRLDVDRARRSWSATRRRSSRSCCARRRRRERLAARSR